MAENAAPTPVSSAGNRRALIFLAIGVALVVLVFAVKMFTGGSSSSSSSSTAPNPLAVTAVAPSSSKPPVTVPAQPAPQPPVDATRNPFQALR